ncbi:MAG: aldo/keto reductase family protein [Trueperaceae bacterium]|nr:aldo/keto reductase family protein [Trueperaceae bacterium]
MNYRRVGNSGLKVSTVSLGAWTTYGGSVEDKKLIANIIEKAVEGGVNFFDNADMYAKGKAESYLGEILKDYTRHHLVLSTKVFWPMSEDVNDRGLSRKHVHESIDMSLERMQTDYVDMYFAHRYDPETPMEEIVETFSDVVRSGRALYWGTSEWSATQIAEAYTFAKSNGLVAPIVEQPQYSMLYRERVEEQILPTTHPKGIGLVVWSPLAMGMLTGKYDEGVPEGTRFAQNDHFAELYMTEANARRVTELKGVADELGITRAQLALAWVLRQPGVSSVITGATKVSQIEDNIQAAEVELSDDQIERIDTILAS